MTVFRKTAVFIGSIVLMVAWLLPGHYLPWTSLQHEVAAAAGLLVVAFAVVSGFRQTIHIVHALFFLALALIPFLQFAFEKIIFLQDAVTSSLYLLGLGLAYLIGQSLRVSGKSDEILYPLIYGLIGAALTSSGIAFLQWLKLTPSGVWIEHALDSRAVANIGQPNHLCTLLAWASVAVLLAYERTLVRGSIAILAASLFGWGMVMTQSRTGWLQVGIFVLWWFLMRRRVNIRLPSILVLLFAAGFFALTWFQPSLHNLFAQPTEGAQTAAALRTEGGLRPLHWRTLLDSILLSPITGFGWNQISLAQLAVAQQHPSTGEMLMHSHNIILDLLIYNGIPLGALLTFLTMYWGIRAAKSINGVTDWSLFLMVILVLTHAAVEYPLHYAYFLLPTGLMVGLLSTQVQVGNEFSRKSNIALSAPLIVVSALFVWVVTESFKAEQSLRELRFATARIGITMTELQPPELYLLDGWRAYHRTSTMEINRGISANDLALLQSVAGRYPYPAALERLARGQAFAGQYQNSSATLSLICKIYSPHIQDVMRGVWRDSQRRHPELEAVTFLSCDPGASGRSQT